MKRWQIQEKNFWTFGLPFLPAFVAFVPYLAILIRTQGFVSFAIAFSLPFYPFYLAIILPAIFFIRKSDNEGRLIWMLLLPFIFAFSLGLFGGEGLIFIAIMIGYLNVIVWYTLLTLLKKFNLIIPESPKSLNL